MESSRRYRLLIIFAALVFCLSVCFAYAQDGTQPEIQSAGNSRILFQVSQAHATFLQPLHQSFIPQAVSSDSSAVVTPRALQSLLAKTERQHRFWHSVSFTRRKTGLIVPHPQDVDERTVQGAAAGATSNEQPE